MERIHLRKAFAIIAFAGLYSYNGTFASDFKIEEKSPCIGKYQGPFLQNKFNMKARSFTPLSCKLCDEEPDSVNIWNNDETLITSFAYYNEEKAPIIMRGPLEGKGEYRFRYMYFNWLSATPEEWGFNNLHFRAELHLVFYNTKHEDYDVALETHEGIAILSMGFRVREHPSREFSPDFVDHLKCVNKAYTTCSVNGPNLLLYNFLPKTLNYYTYTGTMVSYRYPRMSSCTANVIWIEFEETHKMTPEQAMQFQSMLTYRNETLIINQVTPVLGPKGIIYSSEKSYLWNENVTLNSGQCGLTKCMANGFLLSALIFHTLFLE